LNKAEHLCDSQVILGLDVRKRCSKPAQIGDILEIRTPGGFAYAQYTHEHDRPPRYGALIRILPGLFAERPGDLSLLAQQKERFSVFFPLAAALRRGIVSIVADAPVPERCLPLPIFRSGIRTPSTGQVMTWWLWDGIKEWRVGKLAPSQEHLPVLGVWNDTLLIERIASGWSPSDET
jgi:hypothetical protein